MGEVVAAGSFPAQMSCSVGVSGVLRQESSPTPTLPSSALTDTGHRTLEV